MRSSFVFYDSWWEAIKNLPRDVQGDVLTAIIEYGLSGETTGQLKPITKAMLAMVKPQIDANNQRYENGKKGGRPPKYKNQEETNQKPKSNQDKTNCKPNDNVNVNDNDNSLRGSDEPLCGSPPHAEAINYQGLIDFFNSETKGVFGYVRYPISDKRKGMINARIKEHGKASFAEMIRKAYASDFLRGQNKNNFKATFDWLIKPTNFEKVISGNYENRISNNDATATGTTNWASANSYARPSAGDKAASREAVGQFARAVLEKYKSQDGD